MNTDLFIREFIQTHLDDEPFDDLEKIQQWIYNHPTVVKITEIAGIILGAAAIILLPWTFPALGFAAVFIAFSGGLVGLVGLVAYNLLDIVAPPHYDMADHVFTPGKYQDAELYYRGDVPVLDITYNDFYQTGFSHGYFMGASLDSLLRRLKYIKRLAHLPSAEEVAPAIEALRKKIKPDYLRELQGMVDGFQKWSKENKWFFKHPVTVDDLILFHLMPDTLHFCPEDYDADSIKDSKPKSLDPLAVLGCTWAVDFDDKRNEFIAARDMDWPTFGEFGTKALVIKRNYPDKQFSTIEVGFPGFVGTITGMRVDWNDSKDNLVVAMNVCSGRTRSIEGAPAALFNRECLECKSVEEVEEKILEEAPLGPYHMNLVDCRSAESIHFYQGDHREHVIRKWQPGKPLITTNCRYPSEDSWTGNMHCSIEREQIITKLFEEATAAVPADQLEKDKLLEATLSLPYVNNSITAHKVVMYPQSGKMRVAWDNAFAGQAQLQDAN